MQHLGQSILWSCLPLRCHLEHARASHPRYPTYVLELYTCITDQINIDSEKTSQNCVMEQLKNRVTVRILLCRNISSQSTNSLSIN